MSFVRPEARAALWRLREVLAAGALAALGLYWLTSRGLVVGLGAACLLAAVALAVVGVQRARFRIGSGGPGIVSVDEGQIAYFGPLTGGVVALDDVLRLSLESAGLPAHWVIDRAGGDPLHIPVTAEGAETLFDAFAALPGLRTERMIGELRRPHGGRTVIWQREGTVPTPLPLH